ncbi:VOC family protein [Dactylosporangium sp. NPDC005572]|uniref:VOC family protein n=1 Tax=Dactylosporangium sp. NPDC005572 TaxID=3156889 RepID=UPI0033AFDCC8
MLHSADAAAASAFYQELLGWTATTAEDGSTVFLLRDLAVAGLAAAPGRPSMWLTHVSIEDIEATAQLVVDAGGTVLQPETEVATRGRTAVFADASGAVFAVWQRGRFAGAQVIDEASAVCWSEVCTGDVPAAVDFYGKVFGWTERAGETEANMEYHEWLADNRVVGGISLMGELYPPGTPPHWRTILQVADCADVVARTPALGGRVLAGPIDAGVGQAAFLADPAGGTILVIEPIPELLAALG